MSRSGLRCASCVRDVGSNPVVWCCPACGGVLDLPLPAIALPAIGPAAIDPATGRADSAPRLRGVGVWRYAPWLGIEGAGRASTPPERVTMGEPTTPLVTLPWAGREIVFKLEPSLPTGSFKDRGASVLVAWLSARGVQAVVEDSSGNAGAALAAYCARAGIACTVCVPASASPAKLAQVRAYGAQVEAVEGPRQAATDAAIAMASQPGVVYASHLWQPAFLAGTATFAFELWEQLGGRAPDIAVFPVGGGTLILGAHHGWAALRRAGMIQAVPKLVGVQVEACAPLATAHGSGSPARAPAVVECGLSVAEGILTPNPPRGAQVRAAVRQTGGRWITVSDAAVVAAREDLGRLGIYAEPTAAAAAAGLRRFLEDEATAVPPDALIVCPITGSGLKSSAAPAA